LFRYEKEVDRFNKIFNSPQFKHYMAGNHDVGFGNGIRHERQALFEKHFGKSSYIHHTTHGYAFVVIDTVALSSDDPVVRQEAMDVLSSPMPSSPRILMTHVPLWREPNSFCGPDRQAMDGGIRDGQGYQYKNLVSKELSDMILDRVQPVTVFSGDDHDYCQLVHRQEIIEMSVPTFSMAQGIRYPGVILLDIADSSLSTQLRWLPNQVGIFITYAYLLVASFLVLAAFHTYQWSKRGHAHFPLKQEELAAIAPPPLSSRQYLVNFFKSVRDVALVAIPTYCFCILFL
jgi:hypothetical protein